MVLKKFTKECNLECFLNLDFLKFGSKSSSSRGRENCAVDGQKDETCIKPLSYFSLFQYSTSCEKACIVLAVFLAIISGCFPPIVNVLYGEFCNLMIDRKYPTDAPSTKTFLLAWFGGGRILQNASNSERQEALKEDSKAWGLGCTLFTFLQFLCSLISVFILCLIASRQVSRIKIFFFKSLLCKDLAWFETRTTGNFAGQTSDNLTKLEAGIGGVIGIFVYLLVIMTSGVIISFIYGWKLTFAIIFTIPISFGVSSILIKVNQDRNTLSLFVKCFLAIVPSLLSLFLAEKSVADVLSVFTFQLTMGFINILISFLTGWRLSLVLMMFVIPVFVSAFFKAKVQSKLAAKEMTFYTKAGSVAEEVFTSIRTVVAFEGEDKEIERYSEYIEKSKAYGIKRGIASGLSNGVSWLVIYCSYSVAFAYGVRLIQMSNNSIDYNFTPADLLIVFFGIVTALTNLGYASTHIETFSLACGAAASVFEVINTKSKINPCSGEGTTGDDCWGEIEFRNVHFAYPSRPSVPILKGLNLKIKSGEVVAIVGGSGAGKSTVLQLVQRLYDPSKGEVLLDGRDIKSLKVSWLRQQLGVVGQEPLLFSTTIRDNILYGNLSASNKEIEEASVKANAHDFIMKLNDGYNTVIGQKGSTLSGGQKQRIAIARALIRNPKILLLDEATSALDANSEKIVQAALDRAAEGRTTLIVTHRLSTIANAHRIIVLAGGVVSEEGTHNELIAANGIYKQLLQSQAENIKERRKPQREASAPPVTYEDTTVLPPGPRSRFSSGSSLAKGPKGQPLEDLEHYRNIRYFEIMKWCYPERVYISVGTLASVIGGAALPVVCILFGQLFGLLSLTDFEYIIKQTDLYAIILLLVGFAAGICVFLQMYCFTVAGMKLTSRLRVKAFNCIIHQEIGYFDDEKNKVGALCLRLSEDPAEIQAAMGIRLGVLIQAFSTMTIGIVISFFFDWKITLVAISTVPFVFAGVYLESVFVGSVYDTKSEENASKIAVEVISNIRAVASLGKESFFIEKYSEAVWAGRRRNIKKALLRGFAFAIGQTAPFFGYALTLWYGGILIADEDLHYKYVIMVSELLIFGAWTLGQSVVIGPSFGQTKVAAGRLNYIFLRKPKVFGGHSPSSPDMKNGGSIKYTEVEFAYPTRPGTKVLQNFNVTIKSGQSVAVMGPSGSGKSTVIQLLQRFYDPTAGSISINDVNITEFRLSSLRRRLGLVSQEPVLFDRTIQENITYGDNTRVVSLSEVIKAAQAANIHSFIVSLPLGYNTKLGTAGTQLSGGQKQRIAIARALIRNPQILLLDEATSALDPQSESIVQDALDKASSGRTTITVAHRLGAVRNAHVIYVVEKGTIKEFGTHEELMKLEGLYYSMHRGDGGDDQKSMPETSEK